MACRGTALLLPYYTSKVVQCLELDCGGSMKGRTIISKLYNDIASSDQRWEYVSAVDYPKQNRWCQVSDMALGRLCIPTPRQPPKDPLISHLRLGLPSGPFPSGLPTITLATSCPAHLIVLDLILRPKVYYVLHVVECAVVVLYRQTSAFEHYKLTPGILH
jgi:hypothetical protein